MTDKQYNEIRKMIKMGFVTIAFVLWFFFFGNKEVSWMSFASVVLIDIYVFFG